MTFWDFLQTPLGVELSHAALLLVAAVTAWVVADTRAKTVVTHKKLDQLDERISVQEALNGETKSNGAD